MSTRDFRTAAQEMERRKMIWVDLAAWSDVGRQREINEDRVAFQVQQSSDAAPVAMCIVADGLGGHMGGEVASHWAVETLKQELADLFFPTDPRATLQLLEVKTSARVSEIEGAEFHADAPLMRRLREAIESANHAVHEYALHRPEEAEGSGSTVTMVVLKGLRAYVANVGDSRTYLLREGRMEQLTRDHSVVAELVAAGQITPQEAFDHPHAHLITRCLGFEEQVEADIRPHALRSGDCLLLCSDGLWETVRDPDRMARIIERAPSLDVAAHKLVDAANQAGGRDNITVGLLRVFERPDIPLYDAGPDLQGAGPGS
jgi:serine/threonine protein phosphatase PrpC